MGIFTFRKAAQLTTARSNLVIARQVALPENSAGAPPTEFRIFPWGKHTSEKGDFIFDAESAKSVLQAFDRKGHLMPCDYEHNMVKAADKTPGDGPTPAAAWFKLEVRGKPTDPDGGLFAVDVKWTPRATEYLSSKEYRHYSPAFLYDPKTRRILEVVNVALTNTPAQHDQTPLVAAKDDGHTEEQRPMDKTLLALLKLSTEASEGDAITAITALKASADEAKQLVELSGKSTVAEAKGVFSAWKVAAESVVETQKLLADAKKAKRTALVAKLIKQGMKDRKISPALAPILEKQAQEKHGVKMLKAFLEQAPALVGGSPGKQKKDGVTGDLKTAMETLTADEKKIALDGGISIKDFAKRKLAHQKAGGIPTGEGR